LASALIEQAGQAKAKVGKASLSERNANWIVAGAGATARDVIRLLELVGGKVREKSGVALEPDVTIW
jgi:UDP-N-acetylmuramate dehydrogenase